MPRTSASRTPRLPVRSIPYAGPAELTEAWLCNRRLSEHTRAAYRRDVTGWLDWCAPVGLDPLRAGAADVNAYGRALESTVDPRSGRRFTPATVARKLCALSSWYEFLLALRAVETNPVRGADRPKLGRDRCPAVAITAADVDALRAAAQADTGPTAVRNRAALALLADLGLRVGELVSLNVTDLATERGRRSVRCPGKGGRARRRALAPGTAHALDAYLADRACLQGVAAPQLSGPLLTTATGARLDRHAVFRMVRRLARAAGIPAWSRLSPQALRQAVAGTTRAVDPPTTKTPAGTGQATGRQHALLRDPGYLLWAARARRTN